MGTIDELKKSVSDLNEQYVKSLKKATNDGILLGMKHIGLALNDFLTMKVSKGYPEYIGRNELQTFINTYIKITKEEHEEEYKKDNMPIATTIEPLRKLIYKEDHQMYYHIPVVFETNCGFNITQFEEVSHVAGGSGAGRHSTSFDDFKTYLEKLGYVVTELERYEQNSIPEDNTLEIIQGTQGNY